VAMPRLLAQPHTSVIHPGRPTDAGRKAQAIVGIQELARPWH
jgi:hypothetical protein